MVCAGVNPCNGNWKPSRRGVERSAKQGNYLTGRPWPWSWSGSGSGSWSGLGLVPLVAGGYGLEGRSHVTILNPMHTDATKPEEESFGF
jgi:hypothetical protein